LKEWAAVEAKWWTNWLICVLGIAMILMLRSAFPGGELQDKIDEDPPDILKNSVASQAEASSSDEESQGS